MITNSTENDFNDIYNVINDAAIAYKGIIPVDRWQEPYMTKDELQKQIEDGVKFSCYVEKDKIIGVMGIQDKTAVNLIRHAYVLTSERKKGIGSILINKLLQGCDKPILIGTWKAANWAISFYERHSFFVVSEEEKNSLLKKYWNIPDRQVETSIVLADQKYRDQKNLDIHFTSL